MRVLHQFNKPLLQEIIKTLESNKHFSSLGELWDNITKEYNERSGSRPVSSSYLKTNGKGVEIATKPAPKRPVGTARVKAKKSHAIEEAHYNRLKRETPKAYHGLVDQIAKGSRAAAMKLQCLECVQYVKKEITNCSCLQCPIYSFRPFIKKQ